MFIQCQTWIAVDGETAILYDYAGYDVIGLEDEYNMVQVWFVNVGFQLMVLNPVQALLASVQGVDRCVSIVRSPYGKKGCHNGVSRPVK